MALTSPGAVTGIVRGKIGSSVFTRGVSGPTIRIRVKGRNPRTTKQSTARANLAAASRAYKNLSSTNLAQWRAYALTQTRHNRVTGQAYNPSPIDIFNALANGFLMATPGGTIPTTPPSSAFTGDTITITAAGSAGSVIFTGSAVQTSGIKTIYLLQKLKSANRKPNPKGYYNALVAAVPTTPFINTASGLVSGTYSVGYKFVSVATGQETLPVILGNVAVS